MKVEEIEIGKTYVGGKILNRRTAVSYGSSREDICWANPRTRLPYGGFVKTTCVSTASFAKWALCEDPRD